MPREGTRIRGLVVVQLFDERMKLIKEERSRNIVTDAGDELYARLAGGNNAAGVAPTMMMLGQLNGGSPAKNGSYANLNYWYGPPAGFPYGDSGIRPIDSGYPTFVNKGAGLGFRVTYRCTWGPTFLANNNATFMGTNAVILCNVNPAPSPANTSTLKPTNTQVMAVDVFSSTNKSQQDTLVVTWYQDFLGST